MIEEHHISIAHYDHIESQLARVLQQIKDLASGEKKLSKQWPSCKAHIAQTSHFSVAY